MLHRLVDGCQYSHRFDHQVHILMRVKQIIFLKYSQIQKNHHYYNQFRFIIGELACMSQSEQQKKPQRKQLHIFLASTTSCVINMVVINPLEVAKLKVQYSPATCPQWPHLTYRQLNNCQCTRFTFSDTFKGLSVSLFHALISNTLYMQLYEYQRKIFIQKMSPTFATLTSAMFSRLMVTFVMNPIEAFRVRFTNSTKDKKIKASKSGLKITLIRDLTYSCLYWLSIQKIRNYLLGEEYRTHKGEKNILYTNVIPALIGGSLISGITTPLDTIKTRLQSGVNIEGPLHQQVKKLYQTQGLIGLFAGVQFRIVRNTISSVLYLTLFQHIIDMLESPKSFLKNY